MKITLSKAQWEKIGKETGWDKITTAGNIEVDSVLAQALKALDAADINWRTLKGGLVGETEAKIDLFVDAFVSKLRQMLAARLGPAL